MFRRIRSLAATLAVAALVLGHAAPVSAGALEDIDADSVPAMFDLVIMRPLGLVATAAGVAVFLPAAAVTAVFRPQDVGTTFDKLVKGPAQFTFIDPLGSH